MLVQNRFITLLAGLIWVLVPLWADARVYTINQVSDTQPLLTLTQADRTRSSTTMTFSYTARDSDRKIGIYPPGHDLAFYITNIGKTKKYHLLQVSDIAILPNETVVKARTTHIFRLTFPSVPDVFHLIEGTQQLPNAIAWYFSNVRLK